MAISEHQSVLEQSEPQEITRGNQTTEMDLNSDRIPLSSSHPISWAQITYLYVRRNIALFGALISFLLFMLLCFSAYRSRRSINSGIAYFWLGIAMSLLLVACVRCMWLFVDELRRGFLSGADSNSAMICTVEVCIANETVLTVRSWWPLKMTRSDVEKHGVRVAKSSANRWIAENSVPGGKITRVRFTEHTATEFCNEYTCKSISGGCGSQCSVCLEDTEAGCVEMKKCGHVFHSECLSSWFAQSSKLVCPMCRTDHHSLVPQSLYMHNVIQDIPAVSVLSVSLEEGSLST